MDELGLIAGGHDHHVGQARHVGDVKGPPMCGSICPYQAPSVHGKPYCKPTREVDINCTAAVCWQKVKQACQGKSQWQLQVAL